MKVFLSFALVLSLLSSCLPGTKPEIRVELPPPPPVDEDHFPFKLIDDESRFTIMVDLQSDETRSYIELFERNGYTGNGETWAGHIVQMLEKMDKDLLAQIQFDPEAGAFFAYTKTKEAQVKFVRLLGPVFRDLSTLEKYVKSADRSRIDD